MSNNNDGYYGGGYYYGEGNAGLAGGGGGSGRSIRDYVIMVRERIWWLVVSVFVFFLGAAIYTMNVTPQYTSVTSIRILRDQNRVTDFDPITNSQVINLDDFNTQVTILDSLTIVERVEARLKGNDRRDFLEPYEKGLEASLRGEIQPLKILQENKSIRPERNTLMVFVIYEHPNPKVAALIANLFADEYINFSAKRQIDTSLKAMQDLSAQADAQMARIKEIELRIADFTERYGTIGLNDKQQVDADELRIINQRLALARQGYDAAVTAWEQVRKAREEKRPLWELNFIASGPQVKELLNEFSRLKIERASLAERFRDKHPRMIAQDEALAQTRRQLEGAVESGASAIENEFNRAKAEYDRAQETLASKQKEMIDLDRLRPEYNELTNQLEVNRVLYQHLLSRMQQAQTMANLEGQNAQIIDRAVPSKYPSSPNIILNLAIGLLAGCFIGGVLVGVLALLDDKIKTAFDIESSLGLPLIGIIPRIARIDSLDKARVVADSRDRQTVESFRAIHSTLKLNEESRNAKVILTTSTVPSEGKSFVTTNMAITYAMHGERTVVVDADLRMPNVAKSLDVPNERGILTILDGKATLDDVLIRGFVPNLDILVAGGRSRSPTQVLSSEAFHQLVRDLRLRYDKVLIDSPPLAPVSDALNILPLVDGVLYVIRFNLVKRKTARLNLRRLRESATPLFGAILNNINTSVAGYYYAHYYDKSYKQYYFQQDLAGDLSKSKSAKVRTTTSETGRVPE